VFNHILVPLDGSAESTLAVTQACAIAALGHARVSLLRVYSGSSPTPETLEYLHKAALECGNASVEIDVAVLSGDPTEVILEQVDAREADLVVMRTRGRGGLSRAVLGSVAEGIVKRSPSPVLLLPPQADATTAVRTILVPVDGTPGSSIALGVARVFALQTAARLCLRQIVASTSDETARSAARANIEGFLRDLSGDGLQCEGEVLVEDAVPEAIVRSAAEEHADLIVMSSEARTGAARAVLGSVTDAVVRTATRPILVLRRDA
jgi:nucleotide-binding universal stress UspA family protein